MATASISIATSLGSLATSTHDLAGYGSSKYFAYTSLILPKSFISLIKTVVLITFAVDEPAASRSALRLLKALSAWTSAGPVTSSPVAGSIGTTPDVNTRPFTSTAWEYGPIAAGDFSVLIMFLI